MDAGLVSLAVLTAAGLVLVVLDGSAWSLVVLCVTGFRTATVFRRPNTPEVGLLLVPAADGIAVVVDGMPFPAPTVPARVRDAIVEPPDFGSLVGEVVLAAFGAELVELVEAAASLLFASLPVSSFLWVLLRPAAGCLSERDRLKAVAEVDDDMVFAEMSCQMLGGNWDHSLF